MVARVSRRSMLVGSTSLALHGGMIALLLVIAGAHTVPPLLELTPIEVFDPPPAPPEPPPGPSGPGKQPGAGNTAKTGTFGRRGHDAPPHSHSRAPVVHDPLADLNVSYDVPTGPDPGTLHGTTGDGAGTGLTGIGTGDGKGFGRFGDGEGTLSIPLPSLARPPRPKHDYRESIIRGSHSFGGQTLRLILAIDARGVVRHARVAHGLDPDLDQRAIEVARSFEFYPALDRAGEPTSGTFPWSFVISVAYVNEHDESPGPATIERESRRPIF